MEFEEENEDESDLPPEFCRYRDEGCDLADSCLNCPFVKCVYDEPRGKQRWLKRLGRKHRVRIRALYRPYYSPVSKSTDYGP